MRFLLSLSIIALSLLVPDVAANPHGSHHAARRAHDSLARRAPGDVALHKRFDNTRFTFYDVGLGACGQYNVASDFIVALNTPQYGGGYPGPNCFKKISISFGGKSTIATIMDQCPGCPYGGLDLSRGLFRFFASESAGVIYGEWHFVDGGSSPDTNPDPPKTTTKTTPKPSPTHTSTKEESTSTYEPPSSTSTSTSSSTHPPSSSSKPQSSSSSSSSINYSSGAASNLAVPTGVTVSDDAPHNLLGLNQAIIAVGGIIVAGARAE